MITGKFHGIHPVKVNNIEVIITHTRTLVPGQVHFHKVYLLQLPFNRHFRLKNVQ